MPRVRNFRGLLIPKCLDFQRPINAWREYNLWAATINHIHKILYIHSSGSVALLIISFYIFTIREHCCVRSYLRFHTTIISKPQNEIWWNYDTLLSLINCTTYYNFIRFNSVVRLLPLHGSKILGRNLLVWSFPSRKEHEFIKLKHEIGIMDTCSIQQCKVELSWKKGHQNINIMKYRIM